MLTNRLTSLRNSLTFLKVFLRNPVGIGAVAPSSRALAKEMVRDLKLNSGETILELGPGTGSFTTQINRIIPDPKDYLGIEREPLFIQLLRKRFPDLDFVTAGAEDVRRIYEQAGLNPVKVIISSLPFAGVKSSVHDLIIENIYSLVTPGCIFRTFQYMHTYFLPSAVRFRRKMGSISSRYKRSRVILRNFPPAYVLTWTR
ncbi:MAG: methyltransferase domain-containing protein [Candidatus Euphemobacter frigidus]|nr:methyltransferase domain-containing protein [Candidatus Euphemobacter frigidus]MDP8276130.1 methyltransferase domain-containing protein [Candidatus Euphemobacter frigidus]